MLKERTTYEIMKPEDVGIAGTELVLGKHSGRHAFRDHISDMGFQLKKDTLEKAYQAFIVLADKKKTVYDDDLVAIVQEYMSEIPQYYLLDYLNVTTGTDTIPTATVRLKKDGVVHQDAACGDGPVDAALKTMERITGEPGKVLDFSLHAITQGKDALGEVSVQVSFQHDVVSGKGSSTDIVEASSKAYLNALNRYLFSRRRQGATGRSQKGQGGETEAHSSKTYQHTAARNRPHGKRVVRSWGPTNLEVTHKLSPCWDIRSHTRFRRQCIMRHFINSASMQCTLHLM